MKSLYSRFLSRTILYYRSLQGILFIITHPYTLLTEVNNDLHALKTTEKRSVGTKIKFLLKIKHTFSMEKVVVLYTLNAIFLSLLCILKKKGCIWHTPKWHTPKWHEPKWVIYNPFFSGDRCLATALEKKGSP